MWRASDRAFDLVQVPMHPSLAITLALTASQFKPASGCPSDKALPPKLKRLIEAWVEVHEEALLEQWRRAMNNEIIEIVG
jgi:hypothetical protein